MNKSFYLLNVLMLVLVMMFVFSSCSENGKNSNECLDGLFTMKTEFSEYTVNDTINLSLYNNTSDEAKYDDTYILYRLKDGAYEYIQVEGELREPEVAHLLEANGSTAPAAIGPLSNRYDDLDPGIYLIKKEISVFKDSGEVYYSVYAVFELVE